MSEEIVTFDKVLKILQLPPAGNWKFCGKVLRGNRRDRWYVGDESGNVLNVTYKERIGWGISSDGITGNPLVDPNANLKTRIQQLQKLFGNHVIVEYRPPPIHHTIRYRDGTEEDVPHPAAFFTNAKGEELGDIYLRPSGHLQNMNVHEQVFGIESSGMKD